MFASALSVWISLQLARLREAVQGAQRREAAAKAVLAAATAAAREGRSLSAEERADAEKPILFPEQYAAEQERKRAADEQVCTSRVQSSCDSVLWLLLGVIK